MKRVFSLATILFVFSCLFTTVQAQNNQLRNVVTPGYYYFEPDRVAQDSQNAAITLSFAPPRLDFAYQEGIQVVFKTEESNGNNGNIDIRIDPLTAKDLLARDGHEFEIGELPAGVMITATYDGTSFIANLNRPRQFRYVEPTDLTVTNNAYEVTDPSIPPVSSAAVLLGIKALEDNTGNVTLSVNGSLAYPVFQSDGSQIPAGALEEGEFILVQLTNVGGIGFRALNLRPPRSVKGKLVASLVVPAGDYTANSDMLAPWTTPMGVDDVSVIDFPGGGFFGTMVTDGAIQFPSASTDTQLGWSLELLNGSTPVFTSFKLFGYGSFFSLEVVSTDDPDINFVMRWPQAGNFAGIDTTILVVHTGTEAFTLPNNYTFNLYLTEN